MKKQKSNELEEYVREALEAVSKGVAAGKGKVEGTIDFDVAVTSTKEGDGGFKIYVMNFGSKLKNEKVTHLHFKVRPSVPTRHINDVIKKAKGS